MNFSSTNSQKPDAGKITISYSFLGLGLLILITIILAIAGIDFCCRWSIELKDYISMASFGLVTLGLIYNATALQFNFEINKQKLEVEAKEIANKRVKITYEAVSEWYKADMATNAEIARRFIHPFKGILNNAQNLTKFKDDLARDENLSVRKSIIAVLNYFEHLSLLLADHVIDEEILKKAFKTAFVSYYLTLKEYIQDEQRGNEGANSRIYVNFVNISEKWLYN